MGTLRDGISVNRKDRSRPILTLCGGSNGSDNIAQLGGIERSDHNQKQSPVQQFEAALWAARNTWSIKQHCLPNDADGWLRGQGLGTKRLDKQEADNLLSRAFAALDEATERPKNSLAKYRRDGGK